MDSVEVLKREIAEFKDQIKVREAALHAIQLGQAKLGKPNLRFYNWRPLDAIRQVLTENGGSLARTTVEALVLEGGVSTGKKRAHHNVRISIDTNIEIGNLIEKDGVLSLPIQTPS